MDRLNAGWRRVRLGEILERHVERIEDIRNFTRFVGVDHLDSDDLRLHRHGEVGVDELPPTFRYVFRSGMVLVPTRRPQLRKCAVAPFDGLTGEKVLVLKAKVASGLHDRLAPFLVSSPRVQDWNVEKEIGSVTPHFRWGDMAAYELSLPPLIEQRRFEAALTAAEAALQAARDLADVASRAGDSFAGTTFRGEGIRETVLHPRLGPIARDWQVVTVGDLTELSQYGLSTAPQDAGRYPILRMMNLVDGKAVENDVRYVDIPDELFAAYRLESGDVLFNRTNSIELVGRTGVYSLEGDHVFASYLVRLKVKPNTVSPEYLTAYLNAPLGRQQVLSFATKAVSQANVNASNLAKVLIPLPPKHIQDRIVTELSRVKQAQAAAQERAQSAARVKAAILRDLSAGSGGRR